MDVARARHGRIRVPPHPAYRADGHRHRSAVSGVAARLEIEFCALPRRRRRQLFHHGRPQFHYRDLRYPAHFHPRPHPREVLAHRTSQRATHSSQFFSPFPSDHLFLASLRAHRQHPSADLSRPALTPPDASPSGHRILVGRGAYFSRPSLVAARHAKNHHPRRLNERRSRQLEAARGPARLLLRAVRESARQLSRRLFHLRGHFHDGHHFFPWLCACPFRAHSISIQLAHGGSAFSLRFLSDPVWPLQCFFAQSLRVWRDLYHGRQIRPGSSPSALLALSSAIRYLPHRISSGSRRGAGRGRLGFAAAALSLELARSSAPFFFRSLRRPHLHLRLPLSLHVFVLV